MISSTFVARRTTARTLLACLFFLLMGWLVAKAADEYTAEEREHWSLQPRSQPAVPQLADREHADWLANPVDAFVLHGLVQNGLRPAAPASRPVLIRRLNLSLTGLPPDPADVKRFASDASPDAYERLVDRLLAHPAYGEAFGQHWLDVARYAESEGFEYDRHRAGAWRFRDYVIDSFNADKPYDQFVLEQVAGDELADAGEAGLVAAGFHRLGPVRRNAGNTDVAFSRNEVLTEMTDAIGTCFLGLTVGCARCHDHMFDPIKQRDYYRLQAFLAATHEHDVPLGEPAVVAAWKAEHEKIQAEIKRITDALEEADGDEREKLTYMLRAARKKSPLPLPTISSVVNDGQRRTEVHVLERGDTSKPRELVGPRVLGVLLTESIAEHPTDTDSPKLLLARWLIDPANPLTARVYANRVWQYQLGRGIVATPNDFGVNGAAPSNLPLLDFLANELIRSAWSSKRLQRLVVTSNAFRQSCEAADEKVLALGQKIDPENRLLWHFSRRRLSAEQLRDSMLAIAGRLNTAFGGESVMPPVDPELVALLYDPEQWKVTPETREHDRRSIYLVAKRNLRLPLLEVFDQPDLQTSCARRVASTHAPQSLELLNGDFANRLASDLAERLKREAGNDVRALVAKGYWLAAGRAPTEKEAALAKAFLADQPLSEFALALFNLNAFLYFE